MPVAQVRFREDDLSHVKSTVSRCAEQILASEHLAATYAARLPWGGILIQPAGSTRRWPPPDAAVEHCHLLDQIELAPEFSVYALSNRAIANLPADQAIIVCPWFHRGTAAQFLWTEILGHCSYERHVIDTYLTLGLEERAANDQRPGYSKIRHGTLFRFDAALSLAARTYFVLDKTTTPLEPKAIALGGDTHLVFACSNDPTEPLRAMIVDYDWGVHMATKELRRWLRSLIPLPPARRQSPT